MQLHVNSVGIVEPFEHVAVTESDTHRPDTKRPKTERKLLNSLETEARAMQKAGMGIAEGKFPDGLWLDGQCRGLLKAKIMVD